MDRFHHGSAHAYARGLKLILCSRGEEKDLDVYEDKQAARWATREADLAPMRGRSRRCRTFDPERSVRAREASEEAPELRFS